MPRRPSATRHRCPQATQRALSPSRCQSVPTTVRSSSASARAWSATLDFCRAAGSLDLFLSVACWIALIEHAQATSYSASLQTEFGCEPKLLRPETGRAPENLRGLRRIRPIVMQRGGAAAKTSNTKHPRPKAIAGSAFDVRCWIFLGRRFVAARDELDRSSAQTSPRTLR